MSYDDYLTNLVVEGRFGPADRLGTANLVDDVARRRGAAAVRTGKCLSLARPLIDVAMGGDVHTFALEVFVNNGPTGFAMDRVELRCHGLENTHLDALNHISFDGQFYGGRLMGDPELSSMADLAMHGLVARGVVADVPASPANTGSRRTTRSPATTSSGPSAPPPLRLGMLFSCTWAATASRRPARRPMGHAGPGLAEAAPSGSPTTVCRLSAGTSSTPRMRTSRRSASIASSGPSVCFSSTTVISLARSLLGRRANRRARWW